METPEKENPVQLSSLLPLCTRSQSDGSMDHHSSALFTRGEISRIRILSAG
jgi:hypothetical protein